MKVEVKNKSKLKSKTQTTPTLRYKNKHPNQKTIFIEYKNSFLQLETGYYFEKGIFPNLSKELEYFDTGQEITLTQE